MKRIPLCGNPRLSFCGQHNQLPFIRSPSPFSSRSDSMQRHLCPIFDLANNTVKADEDLKTLLLSLSGL